MLVHPQQEEKKKILQHLEQEQSNSENRNHMETFREMQKRPPVLQHATYRVLAGAPPQEKSECMGVGRLDWGE